MQNIRNPARPKISHWNHFNDKVDREVVTSRLILHKDFLLFEAFYLLGIPLQVTGSQVSIS